MNPLSRIVSVFFSVSFLFLIFELVRKKKLKEKYALLWLVVGMTILSLAIFNKLLFLLTRFLGIAVPVNTLYFLGIFFLMLFCLHFSLIVSDLNEKQKQIIQKLSLIEFELKKNKQL